MTVIEQLLAFIAPHECIGCAIEGHLLCARCYRALPPAPATTINGVYRLWPGIIYDAAAKSVVHMLKFERAQAAAIDIAAHMAALLPYDTAWVVTHIPTAPSRIRQRGYDQSQAIAKLLAARIGAPYIPLLARVTAVRQVGASRAARQAQMNGAFRPRGDYAAIGPHVLVIDDVLTTGSTIQAAAQVLLAAGVSQVSAAVFASA